MTSKRTNLLISAIPALYIGIAAWGADAGWQVSLLPERLIGGISLPATLAAMLLSGNVHAPGSLLIGLLTFLECLAVVYAVTNAVRSGAFSRQYSKR